MPQSVIVQQEYRTDVYHNLAERVKEASKDSCGVMFLYCSDQPPQMESRLREILQYEPGLEFEIVPDSQTDTLAIMLPGHTLAAAHYQALLIKHHLQETMNQVDPRITLTVFPGQVDPMPATLKQMAESAKLSVSSDIQIFTKPEALKDPGRILIVDHDDTIREFLRIRLHLQGYETLEALDGKAALELIEKWEPDVVLTEFHLYGIDGLPFIRQIQKLLLAQTPKIVVLTGQRVDQTISQCFKNGIEDYVTKPFSPVELDARIRRCFN
ncbi:response regulator [Paenibacillus pini]|uniref:Two component transcriptional regulator n=1 Tax=Paenibacillus pini JCM 16418 TaxID=1236976 RepID=W7YFE1_9BACL|nr:response regulator transcription factor [Paenibacillus pini]GAF07212.1 two component transcriptional regulator [Paenibacillus pini JCM 16418]